MQSADAFQDPFARLALLEARDDPFAHHALGFVIFASLPASAQLDPRLAIADRHQQEHAVVPLRPTHAPLGHEVQGVALDRPASRSVGRERRNRHDDDRRLFLREDFVAENADLRGLVGLDDLRLVEDEVARARFRGIADSLLRGRSAEQNRRQHQSIHSGQTALVPRCYVEISSCASCSIRSTSATRSDSSVNGFWSVD